MPVPEGVYHVLVMGGELRTTRSGTHVIRLDLQVVTPRQYFGRRLGDVLVPLRGEVGEATRERMLGYGLPRFIVDDYVGGGLLPVGNEAGLALAAAELTGRLAYVYVRLRRLDLVSGGADHNDVLLASQLDPER